MPIAAVRTLSLAEARSILLDHDDDTLAASYGERHAWLGFEPSSPSPVRELFVAGEPTPTALVLRNESIGAAAWREDARKIVAFVKALHAQPEPWLLSVHCTFGEGRSGAVALWLCETYRPEFTPTFRGAQTEVHPVLLQCLRQANEAAPLPELSPKEPCPCCQGRRYALPLGQGYWVGRRAKRHVLLACSVCERQTRQCIEVHRARRLREGRSALGTLTTIVAALGGGIPRF